MKVMEIVILSPFTGFSHKLMCTCPPFIFHCWTFCNFHVPQQIISVQNRKLKLFWYKT